MAAYIKVKEEQCKQLKKIRVEGDSQRTIAALKEAIESQDWIAEGIISSVLNIVLYRLLVRYRYYIFFVLVDISAYIGLYFGPY